jgi:hemolysin III
MDRTVLLISTLLALVGAVWGAVSVHRGSRTWWTLVFIAGAFVAQLVFLELRGQMRGACPLRDQGEILVFLAWSLTLFYLVVGRPYRLSLVGLFTAPVVVLFQAAALWPGVMSLQPERSVGVDAWREAHAAISVLAYGAFALAAVTGVMFLVLDRQLKEHHLQSGLFRNLPPVRELLAAVMRLLWIGYALLTFGISALYHRITWSTGARAIWRKLDHAGIYLMIAGTFTPVAMLGLSAASARNCLMTIWIVALAGIVQSIFFVNIPKIFSAVLYLGAGYLIVPYMGELQQTLGALNIGLLIAGGVAYTLGAICYGLKRPVLDPRYFGYHEVFHLLVNAGAILHFFVINDLVLPG